MCPQVTKYHLGILRHFLKGLLGLSQMMFFSWCALWFSAEGLYLGISFLDSLALLLDTGLQSRVKRPCASKNSYYDISKN